MRDFIQRTKDIIALYDADLLPNKHLWKKFVDNNRDIERKMSMRHCATEKCIKFTTNRGHQ